MTRQEAIRQALEELGIISPIDNPSAEDARVVGRRLDQERARLIERGLCWWDEDDIPASVADAFCCLVASCCQGVMGRAYTARRGETDIAAVKSSDRIEPQQAEYM